MRKIIVSNLVSLDGFMAGPNGEIDWFRTDEEFDAYCREMLGEVDTILFGRVTYEMMAEFWPSTTTEDPVVTAAMNDLAKVVFSRTLDKVEWNNSRLVRGDIPEEIARLKQQPGKDLIIFGSGDLLASFMQLGLIDEYRIIINPVILGAGKPLFKDVKEWLGLKFVKSRTFPACGSILLYYEPDRRNTER